ncbi:acylglycerol kinase, mitochondrial [Belonocnema kinseyi]|uniref:acylglycerol kinase, mitochondrial n=1 Tax=Belonocnema kinseyi TaxID=2817044 RepID=UPI00143D5394|nr:acylglycerol kinase, mitochondrial [Belonocnema kinseyi]
MARVVNFLKTIRNNWKKSLVGSAALAYGVNYSKDAYDTEQMMREFCVEAAKYGDIPIPPKVQPTHMTVILNPVAKKRKAKKLFEKYCEPLLHLAGIAITVIQTESESQARTLVANLNTRTDAIIVAGGDGTLSDVVTGLMRKCQSNVTYVKQCPIGVLPLGQVNRVADSLLKRKEDATDARALAEATMAIVRGNTRLLDTVEVSPIEKDPEDPVKPAYAVGAIEWGAWKDANSRVDKYWYWGSLRRYVTYVFNGRKDDLNWNCNGVIRYSDPCDGCSRCYQEQYSFSKTQAEKRWWHAFVPRINTAPRGSDNVDYSKVNNENCGIYKEVPIASTELHITTNNVLLNDEESEPGVKVELGPATVSYTDFIAEGCKRVGGKKSQGEHIIKAKNIELHPEKDDSFVSIINFHQLPKTMSFLI